MPDYDNRMTNYDLPSDCQNKFSAAGSCIACGVWVDALMMLGDIARCPKKKADCGHHDACERETARYAGDLEQGLPIRSRLADRLRRFMNPSPLFR